MIPITSSFLRVLPENASLPDVDHILSSNTVLLVGPLKACNAIVNGMKAAKGKDTSEFGKKAMVFVHASSLTRDVDDSIDSGVGDTSKRSEFIPYIVIITDEGSRAMKNVEDNLSVLDVEYLKKPSVDAVNWRSNLGDETKDRTPTSELATLSSRFKIVVHTVYGDHQESIDKNAYTLYGRMKAVVCHPEIRLYSSW